MTVRIETGDQKCTIYPWWINFLDQRKTGWIDVEEIGQELYKWNATWVRPPGKPHELTFDTENDLTLFLLRWS